MYPRILFRQSVLCDKSLGEMGVEGEIFHPGLRRLHTAGAIQAEKLTVEELWLGKCASRGSRRLASQMLGNIRLLQRENGGCFTVANTSFCM